MHGFGCDPSGSHCENYGCGAGYDITSSPNAEELDELVGDEHSRIREAWIMLAAVIRAKTPPNREVSDYLSSLT